VPHQQHISEHQIQVPDVGILLNALYSRVVLTNNQCAQGSPSGAGRTEKSQNEEIANASECQQYCDVEPIFEVA